MIILIKKRKKNPITVLYRAGRTQFYRYVYCSIKRNYDFEIKTLKM